MEEAIGSKIADRGFSYLFFFLAIISVNLAVLNFLPLPIVDGGLFLYLIYEKLFKKPPSIAFQNAAAVLGLGLIATLFLVTFYNDIARLVGWIEFEGMYASIWQHEHPIGGLGRGFRLWGQRRAQNIVIKLWVRV